jgi:crotonobetainyl-CoA:carnitine CoA-transferase CaiB-like acyl-CoA transferase
VLSGYGIAGDWSALPAHGLNMDALAGTLPLEWTDDKPSIPRGYRSVGTTLAGVEAALGIYAALHRRSRGGGGQVVQVSIWESALAWMWRDVGTYANTQQAWPEYADFGSRYAVYATGDKKGLLVCPIERSFWERFCDVVGLPHAIRARGDWTSGTDLGAAYVALGEADAIQRQLSLKSRDEWVASLAAADVPIAPVLDWREAMSSSHAEANGALFDYQYAGNHVRTPAAPVSITPSSAVSGDVMQALANAHRRKIDGIARAPYLGEHNVQVSREIGVEIDGQ